MHTVEMIRRAASPGSGGPEANKCERATLGLSTRPECVQARKQSSPRFKYHQAWATGGILPGRNPMTSPSMWSTCRLHTVQRQRGGSQIKSAVDEGVCSEHTQESAVLDQYQAWAVDISQGCSPTQFPSKWRTCRLHTVQRKESQGSFWVSE
jgi:hypothetical protein